MVWLSRRAPRPFGELEIYRNGRFASRVQLGGYKKSILTAGSAADIPLLGNDIPPVVLHIYAERTMDSQKEMVVDFLHPTDGTIEESRVLRNGDDIVLSAYGYRLRYIHLVEEEGSFIGEQYA
jgi:hypothetical protein